MANVHYNSKFDDQTRRQLIYAGDLFVYAASSASLELVELARQMLSDAFAPHHPETAQHHLDVEEYAGTLAELKPAFIHHPECKKLLPKILDELGCDECETFFDVPRLRTSTAGGYLTSGIAYAFHPHRDTWYSAPQCQINWWLPVWEISADNCMVFYPKYFDEAVKNSSYTYNYYRWNRDSRAQAANQIGKDERVQPKAEVPVDLSNDLRLVPAVGEVVVFSAAHLHASVPNTTDRTRLSIDFRTVNLEDVRNQNGAQNVDSECTGTTLRDYLRCSDLEHVPDDLIAPYDTEDVEADAPRVFDPKASLKEDF